MEVWAVGQAAAYHLHLPRLYGRTLPARSSGPLPASYSLAHSGVAAGCWCPVLEALAVSCLLCCICPVEPCQRTHHPAIHPMQGSVVHRLQPSGSKEPAVGR